ncbi:disintegrin and metalloproteinase domain-containing protein 32 isoform X3 [Tursiops truncatus]|uniref:disintegrin and metalloproteinase domain-containing protein 32 isoform X3 n=1 Tax=Tursiops truncatus TaxID=9739 RepID=UPI003CCF792C
MFRLMMLLAGLRGLLTSRPGFQNSFLQIIFPEKIQANTSDNSKVENEQVSYIIPIDEKPYTVHLRQRFFLADNFMVYLYNQGSVNSHSSNIQTQCYYQGYIEGYLNSVATLSTCSGLRGILQFENLSYGIEPLESAVEFQHLLYKLGNENNEFAVLTENNQDTEQNPMDYNIFISEKPESAVPDLIPLYLEMHIVVDKVLYDYLGSDSMMVTNKVIEIIGLVNSMFTPFKITIVLSSLELWSDKNKISTVGEADELLHAFLEWKKSYLTLRPHDIAYLFIYREYPDYVGAAFPGKMCVTSYSAGIALYPKGITLEAFSIIVTQMLGLSLGISYDDPRKCRCSGAICIMSPKAMQSSGVKTFSNCSLSDFENFISNMGARCLQNKPQMQRAPASICGNGRVEGNEICDCGTEEQCGPDSCCNPRTCVLKPNTQCDRGSCCNNCQLMQAGAVCRPIAHPECDVPEVCNGSSGSCPADITIHNGHKCKGGKAFCFDGGCQDLDARCESIYGKGSKNAPFACYEEIQSQTDRFGNCGRERSKYKFCAWRNLICGRLICTYPFQTPFLRDGASVIYAFVRNTVCITMHYTTKGGEDPMVVKNGSICDTGRICVNRECVESRILADRSYECSLKCNGHGVCTSEMTCNCSSGYRPPDCRALSRIPSRLPGGQDQKAALTEMLAGPHQKVVAKQILSDQVRKVVAKQIPAVPSHRKAVKHLTVVTNNSFRRQWILLGISLRNENAAFSPLVTTEGSNKPRWTNLQERLFLFPSPPLRRRFAISGPLTADSQSQLPLTP